MTFSDTSQFHENILDCCSLQNKCRCSREIYLKSSHRMSGERSELPGRCRADVRRAQ